MRWFRLGLSLSIVAVAIPGALIAATRIRPIHPERARMSPAARRDEILADLTAILTGPATQTGIATTPYVSSTNGLCQRDVIDLVYAREKDGKEDSRLKPVGVRVSTDYHLLGDENKGTRDGWQKACERLAGKKVYWASSESDGAAADALTALGQAVADLRNDRSVTIDCTELGDPAKESRCTAEFLGAAPHIHSAGRGCDTGDCYRFGMGDYEVTIVRSRSRDATGGYSTAIKMEYADILVT